MDWTIDDDVTMPCGHEPPQGPSQLHGVCVFCWRDRAGKLRNELLSRRAADEGAVVVEGFALYGFFDGNPLGDLCVEDVRCDHDEYCTEPVSCTIRRRSVETAGG